LIAIGLANGESFHANAGYADTIELLTTTLGAWLSFETADSGPMHVRAESIVSIRELRDPDPDARRAKPRAIDLGAALRASGA